MKILLITLILLGVLAAAGFAWAKHSGYCAGGDRMQHAMSRVSRELELDEGQRDKLKHFSVTLGALREPWAERRARMGTEIRELLADPSLDRDRALELLEEPRKAMAEHKRELVDAFADLSDSLDPGQRERLSELIARRMERRWGPHRWAH